MSETIISVGNGGFNLATDLIKANIFPGAKLFVCDSDSEQLKQNSEDADQTFLLDKIDSVSSKNRGLVSHIVDAAADSVVVCATLGGMTGTKYAPLIALEAILQGKFHYEVVGWRQIQLKVGIFTAVVNQSLAVMQG